MGDLELIILASVASLVCLIARFRRESNVRMMTSGACHLSSLRPPARVADVSIIGRSPMLG
jgi:hypothetical protein